MALTLTSLTPAQAKPGATIALAGAGFEPGCLVTYASAAFSVNDTSAVVASATEIISTLPNIFQGISGNLTVTVVGPSGDASAALLITVLAQPEIEPIQPLCSIASVKAMLGVEATEQFDDRRLLELIEIASAQIESYCDRRFAVAEYSDVLDGDGSDLLELSNTPIKEVLALSINGIAVDPAEAYVYPNWIRFDSGGEYSARLRGGGRVFAQGLRNISVTYRAGYEQVPAVISKACQLQVSHLYNTSNRQGVVSETNQTGGVTNQYAQTALCPDAARECNRYRRTKVRIV